MDKKTRLLTLSAVFSAGAVVILYFASVWPTGQLGLTALASIFVTAAVIETGLTSGVYVFIISAALGLIILPNKAVPIMYLIFFGYYPVVKSLIERLRKKALQWAIKLVVFIAALSVMWFFFKGLLFSFESELTVESFSTLARDGPVSIFVSTPRYVAFVVGCVVFVIFDYGYSKAIQFYITRVSRFISKRK